MPVTAEGLQKFIDYWLYGVLKTSRQLGNAKVFLRQVQEESIAKFLEAEGFDLKGTQSLRTASDAIRAYMDFLDQKGIMAASDLMSVTEGERSHVTIGAGCPYRSTCNRIHNEGEKVLCFRALALSAVLRPLLRRDFDWQLDSFGVPCHITFTPSHVEAESDGA